MVGGGSRGAYGLGDDREGSDIERHRWRLMMVVDRGGERSKCWHSIVPVAVVWPVVWPAGGDQTSFLSDIMYEYATGYAYELWVMDQFSMVNSSKKKKLSSGKCLFSPREMVVHWFEQHSWLFAVHKFDAVINLIE